MPRNALVMPKMSMTMEVGTMVFWLKQVGEPVAHGEPICEVTTDKVDMEVEATSSGVLVEICAEQGDVVPVGDAIAFIESDTEDLLAGLLGGGAGPGSGAGSDARGAGSDARGAGSDARGAGSARPDAARRKALAVPAARALAARRCIDLADVTPSGPWGTIRVSDVEAHAAALAGTAAPPLTPDRPGAGARGPAPLAVVDRASAPHDSFSLGATLRFDGVSDADLGDESLVLAHCVRALSRAARTNAAALRDPAGAPLRDLGIALARESVSIDGFATSLRPLAHLLNPEHQDLRGLAQRIADGHRGAPTSHAAAVHVHSFVGTGIESATLPLPEGATLLLIVGDVFDRSARVTLTGRSTLVPVTLAAAMLRRMAIELR
ncbi:E3 binding domain-containing protein [Micrococcales bacterium 31B]|nr:E3 binding domain-containing protein [Micrococcales bacterium 31B]